MTAFVLPAPLQPRRVGVLLLATACNLGIWVLTAFFATSEFYRRSIVMGGSVAAWNEVLDVQLCTALIWAALTPLIVLLAERLPLRPPHRIRNAVLLAALTPVLAVLRAALGGAINNLGEHQPVSMSMITLSIGIRTHRDIAILAAMFFVWNVADAQREASARERRRAHAQTLLARAELDELRARLQPRFAVRMLRHIGTVLRAQPKAADALIVELSAILRRSMGRGAAERIPLADELESLDRCLDLCRAGGRFALTARYVAEDDVLACRVPANVLQPVIETVVLDLTAGQGGAVEVRCTREDDAACIEVSSTATPDGAVSKTRLRIPCEEVEG